MEFTSNDIEVIKERLRQGSKVNDLAELINYIISLQNSKTNTSYKLISSKKLGYYYSGLSKKYIQFEIPKKTGGNRPIAAPDLFLKKVQRRINLILSLSFRPRKAAHGFVEQRNIVSNATIHVGKKFILNIDLKDFFPSIHYGRLKAVLQLKPFELKPEFAQIFANFCCLDSKLPQGAPTSPVLTNIVCQRLDSKLVSFAKEHHCYYTRYADDLTFSSDKIKFEQEFLKKLEEIIISEGFMINDKKTRIQKNTFRQEVTGVIVNKKLNLCREYVRNIRAILNNWEKLGYIKASEKFVTFYGKEKGSIKRKNIPSMENVLRGKILFLSMVRGKDDSLVTKYQNQFNNLLKKRQNE